MLDTNVISALMQAKPEAVVVEWLDGVPAEFVWITSITLFDSRFGLTLLPNIKRIDPPYPAGIGRGDGLARIRTVAPLRVLA